MVTDHGARQHAVARSLGLVGVDTFATLADAADVAKEHEPTHAHLTLGTMSLPRVLAMHVGLASAELRLSPSTAARFVDFIHAQRSHLAAAFPRQEIAA